MIVKELKMILPEAGHSLYRGNERREKGGD